jgi:hypothetical protein
MGHAPSEIPQISALFNIYAPFTVTSHGSGTLVVEVVMGAEVPGSNPRASTPWSDLLYHMVYILWFLARDFWCNIYMVTHIYIYMKYMCAL